MAEKFDDLFADGVTDLTSYRMGLLRERERWLTLLANMDVLRDSGLGADWFVIYSEYGAKDITRATLLGEK